MKIDLLLVKIVLILKIKILGLLPMSKLVGTLHGAEQDLFNTAAICNF